MALKRNNMYVTLALAVIIAVGLGLRTFNLSDRSFWFDEAFSWRLIQYPLFEMLERTAQDNHPPLYFVVLKVWATIFGTSPLALRLPSALLGSLTILGMYL